MAQMTVKQLYIALGNAMKKDPSCLSKYVITGDDNEGNGFHGVFFGVTYDPKDVADNIGDRLSDSSEYDTSKLVIVG